MKAGMIGCWLVVGVLGSLAIGRAAPGDPLPPEAQREVDAFAKAAAEIAQKAEADLKPVRDKAAQRLKAIQDRYCRKAMLDEALAIRDAIYKLQGVRPDPGNLTASEDDVGKTFLYRVTGGIRGSIWGTDVYTTDSHLATAAVHAGVLRSGQTGIVKVTILPGQEGYRASTRNGVTSQGYGPWNLSFKLQQAER